jgi:toxin ParE1/3/4
VTGYRLSPLAAADLDDIFDYMLERWGVKQAQTYLLQVEDAVGAVAATPTTGRSCGAPERAIGGTLPDRM